ncbi:PHP domain-containing protein [Ethanoligenens harbinense]|uniref:PHP domain protein n=1 Tax=Ethanoligenens harbinense (strain DSM 18485 / JCM 12961 / CGMCC 1.5033 / YUAN-3) TaxID=663278 RepID=E6U8B4_ETHHY|nr:PHP domain-containing protein [Ethanoligenens harbinense]ADU28233.1 PHP domain protein [Ethanoligenens harbinense YUAN-3]AVQ97229.1 PHP domain-containing protein [Ethanoligenens harbinense YUAN-3]AYF39894.1 PHP domain-containing protein [Ethanoligenens harbinense]
MRGDLHCHTRVSDGSMRVEELAAYAVRIGLDCLAVTDHDSMDGVARAQKAAAGTGLRVIPGLEISAYDHVRGKKVHLLCYAPPKPDELLALCAETLRDRERASLAMIEKVRARYPVSEEAVRACAAESNAVYKQHILAALMDMGFSLAMFGELWTACFSHSKGGFALVETHYPDARDAVRVAKSSGGLVVLAHPGLYRNFDILDELCALGLDGIEAHHPFHSEADEQTALEAAAHHGLVVTGGSDFHGYYRSRVNPLFKKGLEGDELDRFLAALESGARAQRPGGGGAADPPMIW